MKTITFKETQNLLKTAHICRNGFGHECVVSTSIDKILISWKNTFYEFPISENASVNFSENSIILLDVYCGSHTFYLFNIVPVKI